MASGWNGSDRRGGSAPVQPKVAAKKPSSMRGILAGGLVVVLAAIAYFVFFSGGDNTQNLDAAKGATKTKGERESRSRRAAAVIPAPAVVPGVGSTGGMDAVSSAPQPDAAPRGFIARVGRRTSLFSMPAEGQINGIVNTELGDNYYDYDVPENFEEEFKQSLTNKIVIYDDDSPDVVERKQRVMTAKEELRAAMERGEDIVAVMKDAKAQMKKKFEDYIEIEKGLNDLIRKSATTEELADYALAAKKLMEANGITAALHLRPDVEKTVKRYEAIINGEKIPKDEDEEDEGGTNEE